MKKLNGGLLIMFTAVVLAACGNDKTTETDSSTTSTMASDSMSPDGSGVSTMGADTGMSGSHSDNMSGMNGSAPDISGTNGPSNFTAHAASGGMMEVEAAKVAQKSASSKEVKDLATMILNDHTKANTELKKIAQGKSLTVPTAMMPEHQSHLDMLKAKTGADFDKAYLDMMEQDHMKDISFFQQASNSLTDTELKAFAAKTLPVLQKHQDRVKATKSKM